MLTVHCNSFDQSVTFVWPKTLTHTIQTEHRSVIRYLVCRKYNAALACFNAKQKTSIKETVKWDAMTFPPSLQITVIYIYFFCYAFQPIFKIP